MRSSAHIPSSRSAPAQPAVPTHRYSHPIPVPCRPSAVISQEGIEWIYAALYAQSVTLEEIRRLLAR